MTKRFEIRTDARYVEFRSKAVEDATILDQAGTAPLLQGEWLQLNAADQLARLAMAGATTMMVFPAFDMEGSYDARALGQISVPWASTFEFSTQLYDTANINTVIGDPIYVGLIAFSGVNRMILDDNNAGGTTVMARITQAATGGWFRGIRIWA